MKVRQIQKYQKSKPKSKDTTKQNVRFTCFFLYSIRIWAYSILLSTQFHSHIRYNAQMFYIRKRVFCDNRVFSHNLFRIKKEVK